MAGARDGLLNVRDRECPLRVDETFTFLLAELVDVCKLIRVKQLWLYNGYTILITIEFLLNNINIAVYFIRHVILHGVSFLCECMYECICIIFNVSSPAPEVE